MFEFLFYPAFAFLLSIAVMITVIILASKFRKDSMILDTSKGENDMHKTIEKVEKINKCEYCGSIIQNNISTCPSCGAKINKN